MPYGKLVDHHHVARVPMLRLDSAGGISSENCVPNVNMIDHSSVNCNSNKWFNSKRIGLGNMVHNKLQGLGGNAMMDDTKCKCKVIKELLNRQFADNSYPVGSTKEKNCCPLAEHRANIMNSNLPTFHPAIVASTFGSCVPSSTLSYIPKMSYCKFNRCYQGKFKQKYLSSISCNSSNANQKKHFNKRPQKQCDQATMEGKPPEQNVDSSQSLTQTVQSTTSPKNCDKKNGSDTTDFSKQHNEEKCDVFDNNKIPNSEVVNNWLDLCTDDESEDLKIHDVPVSWDEEVDAVKNSDHPNGNCRTKMSEKVFHDANDVKKSVEHKHKQNGHGQAKKLHIEEKNIPHIQIRINSLRPSEVKSENKSATEDKSFVLFVRKENKKCRPSVKKRRRSKAKKTDDDAEECQTQTSQNKSSPKCQNSGVAFMFGLNKTADDSDSSQVPTHSFYMTFEDEHELSDFSDDEESDECDDGHWSDTDSFCSEFASPLNLSLICSVKQQEDDTFSKQLKDINLAWQIQINRTSSSRSLNKKASNPKKNKKVCN